MSHNTDGEGRHKKNRVKEKKRKGVWSGGERGEEIASCRQSTIKI